MRAWWLASLMAVLVAQNAMAVVLWSVVNEASPTMLPPYRGEPSPFPQPKIAEIAAADGDSEAAQAAAQRKAAYQRAQQQVLSAQALQIKASQLNVKGVTQGRAGIRVLIRDNWVGLNQTVPVRYLVSAEAAQALQDLREVDPEAAAKLQERLNERRRTLEKQGIKILEVNTKDKQITIKTHEGIKKIPLVLEP